MATDARAHAPDESGGMLIGYWSPNGDAVITATVEGGPNAVRKRSRFEPDGKWQQQRLDEIYVRSGRMQTYLGDWHSHPDGIIRPSGRDQSTAKAVAKARDARTPHPLTLICIEDDRWHFGVFAYSRRHGFERLDLKTYVDGPTSSPVVSAAHLRRRDQRPRSRES
jgi:integrative and conjugative element protein (TIGR02256 family)